MKNTLIVEYYRSGKNGKWFARIKGRNGEVIFRTSDGYNLKAGVLKAIDLINNLLLEMPPKMVKK